MPRFDSNDERRLIGCAMTVWALGVLTVLGLATWLVFAVTDWLGRH